MSMNNFDKQKNGDLLNCVSLADEQKFIAAYNKMVTALNEYEKEIHKDHPEFDVSKVFKIECLPDLASHQREFYVSIFVETIYPNIPIEIISQIEKKIRDIIKFILLTYKEHL